MISEPASNALLYDIGVGNSWLMTLYMQWQVVLTVQICGKFCCNVN